VKCVLVIDDEPFVRESLQRVLKSPHLAVIVAADAETGLTALHATQVDLVIIDAVLPGMDGVTAIREIRRSHPNVRIIAISGGGSFGLDAYQPEAISTIAYLAACKAAGADETLAKPFETAELRAVMARLQSS
jgi:DNA-binding response OmpR family regulator